MDDKEIQKLAKEMAQLDGHEWEDLDEEQQAGYVYKVQGMPMWQKRGE